MNISMRIVDEVYAQLRERKLAGSIADVLEVALGLPEVRRRVLVDVAAWQEDILQSQREAMIEVADRLAAQGGEGS